MKGKKMLVQAITLGLLLAAPCGAWAAVQTNSFENIDKTVTEIPDDKSNRTLVAYDSNNKITEVNEDVSYRFIVDVDDTKDHATKAFGQDSSSKGGTDLTFNGNLNIYHQSNAARNLTGQGAIKGIDLYDGKLTLNGDTTKIYVESTGEGKDSAMSATGISVWGYGSSTATDNTKNKAELIFAGKNVDITVIGNDSSVGTDKQAGKPGAVDGIFLATDAKVEIKAGTNINLTTISKGTETTKGLNIEGGIIDSKGNLSINSTSAKGEAYGISINNEGWTATSGTFNADTSLDFNGTTNITVEGDKRAVGIYAEKKDANSALKLTLNDEITNITANGNELARGLAAVSGAEIDLNSQKVNIDISTKNGVDNPSIGIWSWKNGSKVNIGESVEELNITGTQETTGAMYGIIAQNNTTESKDPLATINLNALNVNVNITDANGNATGNGLVAMSQGILNVNSNVSVNAENAILARGNATIKVNENSDNTTKLNGDILFGYDGPTSGTGVDADVLVNLTGADSVWNGNTKINWNVEEGQESSVTDKLEVKNFTLKLNDGAQWNTEKVDIEGTAGTTTTGTMYTALNKLDLNGGIVNIDAEKMQGQAVEVENLTGNGGTVNFGVNNTNDNLETGSLVVGNSAKGTKVTANYTGITADDVATKDKFAELVQNSLKVSGNSTFTANVKEGLLTPGMTGVTSNHADGNTLDIKDIEQGKSTATMDGMRDIAATAIVAWRQEDSTLSQRLGELRESDGDQGVWVRMMRGEFEYSGAYKNQYNYFQMGYDKAYGDWHYGAALSHNDGQTAYANGSGDNRSTSLSLYGTWLGERGHYADIVLKEGRLNNEFEIHTAAGDTSGDYGAWGTSLSGEYGMKLGLDNGWYVTPQAQLTFMRIGGEDYTTSNGIEVSQDTLYSTVGRVGFELGKKVSDRGSVYAKASLLHEFAGDADTYLCLGDRHNSYSQDIGNTWYEAGFGVNYKTTENSYLYADVVKTFGDDIKTPWQWNAGMRWSF